MRVLHVVARLGRETGGPARSVQGLVAALCKRGVDAWIYSFDGVEPWIPGVRKIALEQSNNPNNRTIEQFDLVHIHGIWDWRLHKVAAMCQKAGVKYVIAPRGMLEPWSLKQKGLKKRIARWLYQDRDLHLAAALHATAESEAEQLRALGFRNEIIVSPNGVNVPVGTFEAKAKNEGEQRRALFVSRMHPKKGVLELVESWARLKQSNNPNNPNNRTIEQWSCELVYTVSGETEKAYEQKVKDRILALGMTYVDIRTFKHSEHSNNSPDFLFTGPLDDTEKWNAYARADLFVLPTYSENFGIVVAEALWAGVPVITTKGTPWSELEGKDQSNIRTFEQSNNSRCGWWIDLPGAKGEGEGEWRALDDALREATSTSDIDLDILGRNGRALVSERYTWAAVCARMIEGYEKVKGCG